MSTLIDKTYNPQGIEQHWYQTWEKNNTFAPSLKGDAYCIVLPPPNVTGSLHMGHGFQQTIMDILIRYHRMCGMNTLWQAGTDHAGIATQMVVERMLNREGKTRHDLGREKFIEKVWQWKEESGNTITRQLRRLGTSIDWSRERFTMDPNLSHAVREVFIKLFDEGLIYRGKRLVNWDPVLLTAISDLEVVNEEAEGQLWHIRYPLAEGNGHMVVATTRPETMLGDVAVAVHPDDKRYKKYVGKQLKLPLTDRTIPIIADEYVDPEFGSGCVKITPGHDFNDYAVGARHQLEPINIFTPDAHLNDEVPSAYRGLERFKARKKIVADLEAQNLIEKIDKHNLKVPRGDRSNAVIEPYLTAQWYVSMKPLAEPAIKAVEKGDMQFVPENWDKTYFQWMHNIEDWCISRQLWWGHRIPVWYDDADTPYAGHDEADARKRHKLSKDIKLTQDEDVLDTWFSASLWPFSSLGWPEQTQDLKSFFPSNVLVTGFDIIFFWVAKMTMMSLKFMGEVPFRKVYITGLIRDAEGHKMSKSKGNVLDPIDLIDGIDIESLVKKRTFGLMQPRMEERIEKNTRKEFPDGIPSYGTDALRFTYCSLASYTREIRFDTDRLNGYRNFCNKLWNASRYVMMNTEGHDLKHDLPMTLSEADKWILSRLQKTIKEAHAQLAQYRFDLYAQALYEFTWNEFCDWYLELSKPILTNEATAAELLRGTRYTLVSVLESLLRLLHPIIPFITEEIWQRIHPMLGKTGKTIMLQSYPQADDKLINDEIEKELSWVKEVVISIRTLRSEMNISPAKLLPTLFQINNHQEYDYFETNKSLLMSLAKLESIELIKTKNKILQIFSQQKPSASIPPSAKLLVWGTEIFIPFAGFINKEEETARLNREIGKIKKDLSVIENKLQNPQFVDRAPEAVVAKEKAKQAELSSTLSKLERQLHELT